MSLRLYRLALKHALRGHYRPVARLFLVCEVLALLWLWAVYGALFEAHDTPFDPSTASEYIEILKAQK